MEDRSLGLELHPPWLFNGLGVYAAICVVVVSIWYTWWRNHPMYGKNPGGRVYPVVGCLLLILWNWRRIYDLTVDLMRKHNVLTTRTVLPFGLESHITADPQNVEHILKTNFDSYPKGERFRQTLHDFLGDGILNTDGDLWRMQRKIASFEFSMRSLRNLTFDTAQEEIESRLIPLLFRACDRGETLDLQDILKRFSFDNICRLAVGVDPACLTPSLPNLEFDHAFDDATGVVSTRFVMLWWKLFRALNLFGERRLRKAVAKIRAFLMAVIRERRREIQTLTQTQTQRVDLLSRFMDHGEQESEKLSDEFLCDMLVSFFQAGRDSVATALVWFFWTLTHNPQVEAAILSELTQIIAARQDALTPQGRFSFDELKSMHYLQAALFESMRMNAPVPSDLKVAAADDVWPDGTRVRKGDLVGYHPYAMGRMKAVWGADCHQYKPERWLHDGVFVAASSFKFPVFQAGPRICLGKEVAIMQMKLIAASILHHFALSVPPGFQPVYKISLVLAMAHGLPVSVRRR